MNPYSPFHRRFLAKRQGLSGGPIVGGLVPGGSTTSTVNQGASSAGSQSTVDPGGIISGLTSAVGGVTTDVLPSSAHSSTASTRPSSGSTGSTTTLHPASSTPSTSSPLTTHSTTPAPTPSAPIVFTSSDGTSIVYVTSTPSAASATSTPHTSFLQNPSLEGGIFTLVGVVALFFICTFITWTVRKRRHNRLERELAAAVSFDPGATNFYERQENMIEKHRMSASSSGHGHGYGPAYDTPQMAYAPQQEYYPQNYGQYPSVAYCPPLPASYQSSSSAIPQPAGQGGANLTRKFSDRKPVPPLLPEPIHDPANTHVSMPPQIYQQQ